MSNATNNNIEAGDAVESDREGLRQTARSRLAPGSTYAGDVTPDEAWQILASETDAVLVDVRTNAEWNFVGLPDLTSLGKKPLLISWQRFPDMAVNSEFAAELAAAGVEPSASIVFLCRSGARSAAAATLCTADGYGQCFNILEGFEGPLDGEKHRGTAAGWKMRALPWVQG
jgi:rhodanese-related sulfurtransferase